MKKISYQEAICFFIKDYQGDLPLRFDGTIDFESLAGEFLHENESFDIVKKYHDALPEYLKEKLK